MLDNVKLPAGDDIAFFAQNGYWIAPKSFDDAAVETARDHMEMIYRGEFDKGEPPQTPWHFPDLTQLRKTDNSWWADSVMESLATNSTLGHIAALLLGVDEIYLWHDQLLWKPGGGRTSGNIGWHQDKRYWGSSTTQNMVTAWIALDYVNEENGCMRFVPGSNRWGLVNEGDFFDKDMEGQKRRMPVPAGEAWHEVPVILEPGQASFHHCMTLHGSGPNLTSMPRRSLAVHFIAGDGRLAVGHGHANETILGAPDGTPFRGPRFPRCWPPAGTGA